MKKMYMALALVFASCAANLMASGEQNELYRWNQGKFCTTNNAS